MYYVEKKPKICRTPPPKYSEKKVYQIENLNYKPIFFSVQDIFIFKYICSHFTTQNQSI